MIDVEYVAFAPFAVPVLIVATVFAYKAYELRVKHGAAPNPELIRRLDDLAEHMAKLERRVSNLETIVLEAEKHKQFDRAL